ncbi:hypothetical protein AHAS_Ahas17G0129800 [Arachis hypogaea]
MDSIHAGSGKGRKEGKEKGEGKVGKRRVRATAAAAPLPFALTSEPPRPSPLFLSFPVSDLLELELTPNEELSQHSCCPPAARHLRPLVTRNLKKAAGPRLMRRCRQRRRKRQTMVAAEIAESRRWIWAGRRRQLELTENLFHAFDSIE